MSNTFNIRSFRISQAQIEADQTGLTVYVKARGKLFTVRPTGYVNMEKAKRGMKPYKRRTIKE